MESITLQTNDSIISSGDPIGQLQFAASNESDGSASRYVIGKIYAQGEGAFNASSNPASIVFATSAANNLPASGRLKISHEGHVLPLEDNAYDLGSSSQRFRHLYVADTVYSPTGELSYLYFDTTVGDVDQVAGQLNWNSEAGSLDLGLTDDVTIHLGQSVLFRVKNSTGSTITKGEAVYASGVLGGGQVIQVAPFAADESVDEVRFIGLMTDDLANGEDGFVNHFGHIKNVDLRTSNTALNPNGETWNIGDILFVDDTSPGGLTKVQPKDDIYVALVLADGQNGELFVRITDPGHINDLHDVDTSGLVDNNLLVWNSGANYWEPTTSLTFDGTTLHTDTDGISAIFGRSNAQTVGGKVRIYVDDGDTASSVQAIKAFNAKTTGTNYGINATANGLGATKNVGLYGWAAQATTNWGLWVDAGYAIFDDRVGIKTSSPSYDLHVNGSGNITGDMIVGGNLTIQGNTVTANVATMEIEDPIFTLGLASGTIVTDTNLDRGLALALNNDTMAFIGWDVSESEFSLLSSGVATNSSGNYAPGTYGDLHIGGLTATTANFSSTIDAANLGTGEDNSVVILDSDGKLRTDEIDSRVWGSTLADMDDIAYVSGLAVGASGVNGTGSSGQVAFWTGTNDISGDSSLFWDDANDRLGINTASPQHQLHIKASSYEATAAIESFSNQSTTLYFIQQNVAGTGYIAHSTWSNGMTFKTGRDWVNGGFRWRNNADSQLMRLTTDGNLGININEPSGTLHVVGTAHVDNLKLDGNTLSATNTDGNLILSPNGNGALQADSDGNARGAGAVDWQMVRASGTQVASADYSVIGGGSRNTASSCYSTVAGGKSNTASSDYASIGGGVSNSISDAYSTIGGGFANATCNGPYATIGGGCLNTASGYYSTVGGGGGNCASGYFSTISGGGSNTACYSFSTVGGGASNTASDEVSTVGGGYFNTACRCSTVSGGFYNGACGICSTVGGGYGNDASGSSSTIGGGGWNTASGYSSTVGGGYYNKACARNSSVSGGRQNFVNARHGSINGGHYNVIQSPTNECCSRGATIGGGIGHNTSGGTVDATTGDITGIITCCNAGTFSTIGGGIRNCVTGTTSTVSGGTQNYIQSGWSFIGGGNSNVACGNYSTIGGGRINTASGYCSTISGGYCNCAIGVSSAVGGGTSNKSCGACSTVGGGYSNNACGNYSTIGGGYTTSAIGSYSTASGGRANQAKGDCSVVSGGYANIACCGFSTIGGGFDNYSLGNGATIAGGYNNDNYGCYAFIGAGRSNTISGLYSSIAAGQENNDAGYANVHILGSGITATQADTTYTQNIIADGHLAATTKSFLVNHPTRPGHKLQYGSLESPYHGIRLTGKGTIQSGWCVIKLPEYICKLVRDDESVNIQITNYKHSKVLYVSDIDIANNEFTIKTDSWFTRNNLEFFWTFTAVRKDVEPLKVEF